MSGSRRVLMTQMSSSLLAPLLGPLSTAEGTGVSSPIVSPSCGDAAATDRSQHAPAIAAAPRVTRADGSFLQELAGQPALDRLRGLAEAVDDEERALLQRGLHLGVVVDEHRVDFGRGDFLVRNVIGADRDTGAIAVADRIQVGQTVQFHVRDADAAFRRAQELGAWEIPVRARAMRSAL